MILDVRYAKAADGTNVAYAELGDGPIDIVYSFFGDPHPNIAGYEKIGRTFKRELQPLLP